jgi:transcription antitermination factor NusG
MTASIVDISSQWFALYTAPRHEKRVAELLQEKRVEAFLPLYRTVRSWKNRTRVHLELPLFPSYVFVRIAQNSKGNVLSVPGALSFVGSRREAWPLADLEIEKLRIGIEQFNAEPHPYLVTGDRARIRSGPFSGMEGVLVEKKNGLRVVLTVEQITRSFSIEVEIGNLERVRSAVLAS